MRDMRVSINLRSKQPINVEIHCTSRIRKWAYDNAYTLTFIMILFAITWTTMVVYGVLHAGQ